ncbi:hypothetical protein VCR14J2_390357 [Vibrio coralliirubri]|nr:hypothetical protein VCR14J2_390357 [Vibrio coralliirubri]
MCNVISALYISDNYNNKERWIHDTRQGGARLAEQSRSSGCN